MSSPYYDFFDAAEPIIHPQKYLNYSKLQTNNTIS